MDTKIARIRTGVEGLDSMLSGGIPENKQILIAGGPGVGKTLLSFEVLYNCARAGLRSVYISFEEEPKDVVRNAAQAFTTFSEIEELMSKGLLTIHGQDALTALLTKEKTASFIGEMALEINNIVKNNNAKMVCVDSISLLKLLFPEELEYRKAMMRLVIDLRKAGATSLIITDMRSSERASLTFEQEYFIFDGIMAMYDSGDKNRRSLSMEVVKMRGTKHSRVLAPFDITPHGFVISTSE